MSEKANTKVGHNNKPPLRAKRSVKNSHTSPRAIASAKRRALALSLREKGLNYRAIARELHTTASVVHGWVVSALHNLPMEGARALMTMELQRLDSLLATHFPKATAGDLAATAMCLRITELRARLAGLFPPFGQPAAILVAAQNGEVPVPEIQFIIPNGYGASTVSKAGMGSDAPTSAPPPHPAQRLLEPPRERYPTPFGVVEVEGEVLPPAGPRTEFELPRRPGHHGAARSAWPTPGKSTDWMGS